MLALIYFLLFEGAGVAISFFMLPKKNVVTKAWLGLTLGLGLILTLPAGLVLLAAVAALAVLWLVCSVLAAVRAWNGEEYRYPLTLRLL